MGRGVIRAHLGVALSVVAVRAAPTRAVLVVLSFPERSAITDPLRGVMLSSPRGNHPIRFWVCNEYLFGSINIRGEMDCPIRLTDDFAFGDTRSDHLGDDRGNDLPAHGGYSGSRWVITSDHTTLFTFESIEEECCNPNVKTWLVDQVTTLSVSTCCSQLVHYFENYCTDCEWSASTEGDNSRENIRRSAIDYHIDFGHTIDSRSFIYPS